MSTCRGMKLHPYLSLCTNNRSRWTIDSSIKLEILKLLKENIRITLQDTGVEKDFLNMIPFFKEVMPTTDNWDLINLKAYV